ncbi:hypothetical protein N748_00405 [Legionella pneumophila str. 121004]|nr:hypothetical protein N748_00405 [Legionella pneumophila str. 121004]ERH43754.1 hypothetical protein N750_11315 [Legionella pneumophila str. Leg01/53]ERH45566.1 hypothetical protein N751_10940 [Legionella pneumophila str. Leg01/11]ERI48775.1 hypothetical protein N749_08835 [Legionella pneumophila str. Leg01/20]
MTELKIFFNKEIGVFRKSCKPVYNFFWKYPIQQSVLMDKLI